MAFIEHLRGAARLGLISSMILGGSPSVSADEQIAVPKETLQLQDCALMPTLASLKGEIPTSVAFINRTSDPVGLSWIDYQGKAKPWAIIPSQQMINQSTFATQAWEFTNQDGQCLSLVVATSQPATAEIIPAQPSTEQKMEAAALEGPILPEYISKNGVVKLVNFPDPTDKFLLSPRLKDSLDQLEKIAQRLDIPDSEGKFHAIDGISVILDPELKTGAGVGALIRRIPGVPFNPFAKHEYIVLIQHIYTFTPEGTRFIELRFNKGPNLSSPLTEEERQNIESTVQGDIAEDIFLVKSGSPEYDTGFPGINDLPARTLKRALYDMQPFKVTLYPQQDN